MARPASYEGGESPRGFPGTSCGGPEGPPRALHRLPPRVGYREESGVFDPFFARCSVPLVASNTYRLRRRNGRLLPFSEEDEAFASDWVVVLPASVALT